MVFYFSGGTLVDMSAKGGGAKKPLSTKIFIFEMHKIIRFRPFLIPFKSYNIYCMYTHKEKNLHILSLYRENL